MHLFADRVDAGKRLAAKLEHLRGRHVVVLGLPRGGVPVAAEVALALDAPLDIVLVRKLGLPFQPELALGAIAEGNICVVDDRIVRWARLSDDDVAEITHRERAELVRRAHRYRGSRPSVDLIGRTVVIVDDGIATGSTARAACTAARAQGAVRVVLAAPVAPKGWRTQLADAADELVTVESPARLSSIGQWYTDFSQTTDENVIFCLDRAERRGSTLSMNADGAPSR